MFQYRTPDFGPRVNAIQKHLGAVEKELTQIGRMAGRRGGAAAAAAGEQIGDTISSILGDMIERVRDSGQTATDTAGRLGSRAIALGRSYGNTALGRVSAQTEERPLLTIGVALGVGILIGAAVLGSMSKR